MSALHPTRRQFLRMSGGALLLNWAELGHGSATTDVPVRKDLASLAPNGPEVASLRRGFAALRQRSMTNPDDPIGWLAQANIHRDSCSHATWWFLPWHRAYLFYFEQMLRDAAVDPTLTLPYWNWTKDPSLPAAFWGADNPLNDPTREIGPNDQASPAFVGQDVIDGIVATSDFITFGGGPSSDPLVRVASGSLEGTPHNYIHRFVGGQNGNMQDPDRAARDPIFWLHHANIDRLWVEWVKQNPGQTPTDQSWTIQSFGFVDIRGNPASITTAQVLDTYPLNYRYDTQAPPPGAIAMAGARLRAEAAPQPAVISQQPLTVTLRPPNDLQRQITRAAAPGGGRRPTLRLAVEGVVAPDNPDVAVRVFLNLPGASAATPVKDPHYVTTFTFFEHRGGAHPDARRRHGPTAFYVNVTPAVRKLQAARLYKPGEPLQFTLMAIPISAQRTVKNIKIPFQKVTLSAHE